MSHADRPSTTTWVGACSRMRARNGYGSSVYRGSQDSRSMCAAITADCVALGRTLAFRGTRIPCGLWRDGDVTLCECHSRSPVAARDVGRRPAFCAFKGCRADYAACNCRTPHSLCGTCVFGTGFEREPPGTRQLLAGQRMRPSLHRLAERLPPADRLRGQPAALGPGRRER